MKKTILFLYVGDQQGAWGSISYPSPYHYYVMPGILYCAQTLRDSHLFADYTIETRYINRSVESIEDVCAQLCAEEYGCIGLSCYTWNTTDMLRLACEYKKSHPHVPIMLGGPDIGPKTAAQLHDFFDTHGYIDALAFGESELKIVPFVLSLLEGREEKELHGCKGYAFHPRMNIGANLEHEHAQSLDHIPEIFPCDPKTLDIPRGDDCGLAIVYETTRGCPYRCIYCRFSMHSHKIRRFDEKRWKSQLRWLLDQRVECLHVADAVFDLDREHAKNVLSTLIDNNRATSLFFYCSFQNLDEQLAGLFQKSQCQIGVGVQSTNQAVLRSIRRALSPRLFEQGKAVLDNYPLNFYTDLIFGLPSDCAQSFQNSFDQVMGLNPSFVMAFPLTLIRGTPLGDDPEAFAVNPVDDTTVAPLDLQCDIHYKNLGLGERFSTKQLGNFDDLAVTLFYYFQRFPLSLRYLRGRCGPSPFDLFQRIGSQTKSFLRTVGRKASNTEPIEGFEDEIQRIFVGCLHERQIGESEREAFKELFKLDIMRILIMQSAKRKQFFDNSHSYRADRLRGDQKGTFEDGRVVINAYGKTVPLPFRYDDLMHLDRIGDNIQPARDSVLVSAPFEHWNATLLPLTPPLEFCIRQVEPRRPTRVKSLLQSYTRQGTRRGESEEKLKDECLQALQILVDENHFLIYAR